MHFSLKLSSSLEILIDMARVAKLGILILILMVLFWECHTLRCQLEDGPSEEELKKVVRICMRKLGDNSDRNNSQNSYEDSDSDENYDNNSNNRNSNREKNNHNNNSNNRGNRFARDMDRGQQQQGYENSYGNRNQQRYDNSYGNNGNNGFNYGNGYNENNRNYNMSNRNRNDENDRDDKSCMIQCFFQEMKMTNSEGFPDKHKVERIVTQDVRDREMKNFLLDSIQECFHVVEMERRRDKCVFSKNIVSCLAERAKANCDDYYNETMIF